MAGTGKRRDRKRTPEVGDTVVILAEYPTNLSEHPEYRVGGDHTGVITAICESMESSDNGLYYWELRYVTAGIRKDISEAIFWFGMDDISMDHPMQDPEFTLDEIEEGQKIWQTNLG